MPQKTKQNKIIINNKSKTLYSKVKFQKPSQQNQNKKKNLVIFILVWCVFVFSDGPKQYNKLIRKFKN